MFDFSPLCNFKCDAGDASVAGVAGDASGADDDGDDGDENLIRWPIVDHAGHLTTVLRVKEHSFKNQFLCQDRWQSMLMAC